MEEKDIEHNLLLSTMFSTNFVLNINSCILRKNKVPMNFIVFIKYLNRIFESSILVRFIHFRILHNLININF